MPESVIYMRGFAPPFFHQVLDNGQMKEDLKSVAALPRNQITGLRETLTSAAGFLDPNTLLQLIQTIICDINISESVQRTLRALAYSDVDRFLEMLDTETPEVERFLDVESLASLKANLKELIQPYPGLKRFRKAEVLATITGNSLESLELVCDLRPIFDENRENLEGLMPYTRLHIVTTGVDGLPVSFEAELTHKQVVELAEKSEKTKKKLLVLRDKIAAWLPDRLPDLPLTASPEKDVSDVT
ncbi:MAG: hypothetical protein HYV27_19215 [Candidatus Hydrogenedentes bacterium]|nr:hypothetical protein [Candidatus Hydrogenedentota bacterium]